MSQDNSGFGSCPTVRIIDEDAEQGFVIINKEDFNDEIHEEFGVAPPALPRLDAIVHAIGEMDIDDEDSWLNDGRPDLESLRGMALDGTITSEERDEAWEAYDGNKD